MLPNKRDAFKLAHGISLGDRVLLLVCLSEHEIEDQLLAPKYDAFDHV